MYNVVQATTIFEKDTYIISIISETQKWKYGKDDTGNRKDLDGIICDCKPAYLMN